MTKFRIEDSGENKYLVIENYHINKVGRATLLDKSFLRMKVGEKSAEAIQRYEMGESKKL